jgi:hypothetical protein
MRKIKTKTRNHRFKLGEISPDEFKNFMEKLFVWINYDGQKYASIEQLLSFYMGKYARQTGNLSSRI